MHSILSGKCIFDHSIYQQFSRGMRSGSFLQSHHIWSLKPFVLATMRSWHQNLGQSVHKVVTNLWYGNETWLREIKWHAVLHAFTDCDVPVFCWQSKKNNCITSMGGFLWVQSVSTSLGKCRRKHRIRGGGAEGWWGLAFGQPFHPLPRAVSSWPNMAARTNAEADANAIAPASNLHSCVHANVKTKWLTNPPCQRKGNNYLHHILYYSNFLQNVDRKLTSCYLQGKV